MHRHRIVFLTLAMLVFASLTNGHAILLTASPSIGQVVRGPDVDINLRFNSRIDAKRSRIILIPQSGGPRTITFNEQSSPDSLNSKVQGLASGPYKLQWQVLAVDGHISRGEVPFKVQ